MSHYAAVAADTFSSELGILAISRPFLITDFTGLASFQPRRVPPGTNGGVTIYGLAGGAAGAALIAVAVLLTAPFCRDWTVLDKASLLVGIIVCGTCGSILDSVMGGLLQASVVDVKNGKVIEGHGGGKVVYQPGGKLLVGRDILSNNGVNFAMATALSILPIAVLWVYC